MSTSRPLPPWLGLLLGLSLLASAQAQPSSTEPAADTPAGSGLSVSWSGFGTLGWAQSNRDWGYQRFIDDQGTLKRDTVLGGQMDLRLGDHWSATMQLKVVPDERHDSGWQLKPAWAFVAWRPSNDWLVRAGKLRVPFFLRSEQMDVGMTYNEVRLPPEIYGIVPTTDFVGAHVTRTWAVADGDLSVDAYAGRAHQTKRIWLREGITGVIDRGESYWDVYTDAAGLVATWTSEASRYRAGLHRVEITPTDKRQLPVRPRWAELVPGTGIGYWQTENSMPGPGVDMIGTMVNLAFTTGAEFSPAPAWKVITEYGRIWQRNTERSIDSVQAYVTVLREAGAFTPYLTLSRARSTSVSRNWTRQLDETTVPSYVDSTGMLNASMRLAADSVPVYDQHSIALGSAYSLSPSSKLKAEWLHTTAHASGMFDLAAGERLFQRRTVDVLSLNYSFVF